MLNIFPKFALVAIKTYFNVLTKVLLPSCTPFANTPKSFSSNTKSKDSFTTSADTLGNKAFSPNLVKIKVGSTVTWTNNDNNLHTVTSGIPNTPNAGQTFDSGLTALIMPTRTYLHKFTNTGEFPYFCRVHPTMVGKIAVVP
jgi:nitrite reductase (NO-forming)